MIDLARHKSFGVLIEFTQAGIRAKIDPFAAIFRARVAACIRQLSSASGFCYYGLRFVNWICHDLNYCAE